MTDRHCNACVVGIGSPHGGDAVGWRAVESLASLVPEGVRVVVLSEPTRLLPLLNEHQRVWVVDACRSEQAVGSITRFVWPDDRIDRTWCVSGHGIGLAEVLELAENLGRSSASTIVYTVDIGYEAIVPDSELADVLSRSIERLRYRLRDEVTTALRKEASSLLVTTTGVRA